MFGDWSLALRPTTQAREGRETGKAVEGAYFFELARNDEFRAIRLRRETLLCTVHRDGADHGEFAFARIYAAPLEAAVVSQWARTRVTLGSRIR